MTLRTIADYDQINVLAVAGCWRKMNLVQQCAASHGNPALQKRIIEQRNHRPAQQ